MKKQYFYFFGRILIAAAAVMVISLAIEMIGLAITGFPFL